MTATFKFVTTRTRFSKEYPKGENYVLTSVQILTLSSAILTDERGRKRTRQEINTVISGIQSDLGAESFTLDL